MPKHDNHKKRLAIKINLGVNILRAIRLQELTLQQWAESNEISLATLNRIVRAKANPTLDVILTISEKLDISVPELFRE